MDGEVRYGTGPGANQQDVISFHKLESWDRDNIPDLFMRANFFSPVLCIMTSPGIPARRRGEKIVNTWSDSRMHGQKIPLRNCRVGSANPNPVPDNASARVRVGWWKVVAIIPEHDPQHPHTHKPGDIPFIGPPA